MKYLINSALIKSLRFLAIKYYLKPLNIIEFGLLEVALKLTSMDWCAENTDAVHELINQDHHVRYCKIETSLGNSFTFRLVYLSACVSGDPVLLTQFYLYSMKNV